MRSVVALAGDHLRHDRGATGALVVACAGMAAILCAICGDCAAALGVVDALGMYSDK